MVKKPIDDWDWSIQHKHRYKLMRVVRFFYGNKSDKLIFRCEICATPFETSRRAIWHPRKMVLLTEATVDYLAERTEFTPEELRRIIHEEIVVKRQSSVWVNIERQLDGTWTNAPIEH